MISIICIGKIELKEGQKQKFRNFSEEECFSMPFKRGANCRMFKNFLSLFSDFPSFNVINANNVFNVINIFNADGAVHLETTMFSLL